MKTGPAGIALIKRFEGLELKAYRDIAGVMTIGYGHTLGFKGAAPRFDMASTISEAQADALLIEDLAFFEGRLNGWMVTSGVELNQNEYDAIISFSFNLGWGAFMGSTFRKRLVAGDRIGAAEAMTWWNRATVGGVLREVTGLTRRRAAEKALFLELPVETRNNPETHQYDRDHDTRCAAVECRQWLKFLGGRK